MIKQSFGPSNEVLFPSTKRNNTRIHYGVVALAWLLLSWKSPVLAQCGQWTETGTAGIGARIAMSAIFDELTGRTILYGGGTPQGLADGGLYAFDGHSWSNLSSTGFSSSRAAYGCCWDPVRRQLYLVCGQIPDSRTNETWRWTAATSTWQRIGLGKAPSPRDFPMVAFDRHRDRVVLFGGRTNSPNVVSQETWEMDPQTAEWTLVQPIGETPAARLFGMMAYQSSIQRVVLYGGVGAQLYGDTWVWNGATSEWSQLQTSSPPARQNCAMVEDTTTGKLILAGTGGGSHLWSFDGSDWQSLQTSQDLTQHAMAYDSVRQRVVIYGGFDTSFSSKTWFVYVDPPTLSPIAPLSTCKGTTESFTAQAIRPGAGPFTYQWRKDSTPIDTLLNPSAATSTLTLPNITSADIASYDCIVNNACGSVTSNPATLTICLGDFNCDGGINGEDIESFFIDWEAGNSAADVNEDGGIDGSDVEVFFGRWEAGC